MRFPTLSFIFLNKDEQDKTLSLFTYELKEPYEFDGEEDFSLQPQESHFEIYRLAKDSSGFHIEHIENDEDNNKSCLLSGLSFSALKKKAKSSSSSDLSQICQDFQDDYIDEWEVLTEKGWDDISLLYAIKRIRKIWEVQTCFANMFQSD